MEPQSKRVSDDVVCCLFAECTTVESMISEAIVYGVALAGRAVGGFKDR